MPLAAAALLARRATTDPVVECWQQIPVTARCLLERGGGWVKDNVEEAVRTGCLQDAHAGVPHAKTLQRACAWIWAVEADRFPDGSLARIKGSHWARAWCAVLDGTTPCPHDDPGHAHPTELSYKTFALALERFAGM